MSKPVELIVINALHDLLEKIDAMPLPDAAKAKLTAALFEPFGNEVTARNVLGNIAAHASINVVLKALAAAGAPSALPEIRERLIATRDSRKASVAQGDA
jgi:hypothetical protein